MTASVRSREDLVWWVALHSAQHVGPARFHRLIRKFGSPRAVLTSTPADALLTIPGADPALLDSIVFAGVRIDYTRELVDRLLARGIRIVPFDDPGFPAPLLKLKWPPGLVYMIGEFTAADTRTVAIIGSTHASATGFRTAYRSAGALAGRGCTIVSGNARGIDSAAHLGALEAGGRTIFVLPDGIVHFRPQVDIPAAKLERQAVVISERPPEAPWEREGALTRNRITAALSERIFIIEAQADDGALHTFRIARRLGIPAMAAVFSGETPDGNKAAIREGAVAVKSIGELLHTLAAGGEHQAEMQQSFDWE
ncbi:MAG TPA: DNA-processing protein DprA [Planctomycetota bacterium]|nr:DNA-processing protein DprA [Planctomycetota bacterium]